MRVAIPERLGRRMSVGPFQDPMDFVRFLVFASVGALVALGLGLVWGLPLLLAGALLTLVRRDEETLFSLLTRRLAYLFGGRGAALRAGRRTAGGWRDGWGRPWSFYFHNPYPVHGRSPEELQGTALRLVRLVATTGTEAVLLRTSEPWRVEPFFPVGRTEDARRIEGYCRLLTDSTKGQYRAELVLGIPLGRKERASVGEALGEEGWKELKGQELARVLRLALPFQERSPLRASSRPVPAA